MTSRIPSLLNNKDRSAAALPLVARPHTPGPRHGPTTSASVYTAYLDPEKHIVAAAPDLSQRLGRTSAEICGQSLHELLRPHRPAVLNRYFERMQEGRCSHFTERVVGLGGTEPVFSGELTAIAVHNTVGRLAGIVVQLRLDKETSAQSEANAAPRPRSLLLGKVDAKVLEGIARGASTMQLATRLHLSKQTVEYHIGLMLRKFKAPSRTALVSRAHSMGMLTVGQWPPRVLPEFIK